MSVTLRPWTVLVLVAVFGVLLGITIGNLSPATSSPSTSALNSDLRANDLKSLRSSNKQVVKQLRKLNSRTTDSYFELKEINQQTFEIPFLADNVDDSTVLIGDIADNTESIADSTFGTCLYVSDDGGGYCP